MPDLRGLFLLGQGGRTATLKQIRTATLGQIQQHAGRNLTGRAFLDDYHVGIVTGTYYFGKIIESGLKNDVDGNNSNIGYAMFNTSSRHGLE